MISSKTSLRGLNDPLAQVVQKIHYAVQTQRIRSLAIQSTKSKEGKSHISLTLAAELFRVYGIKVAIFDSNIEGDELLSFLVAGKSSDSGTYSQVLNGVDLIQVKDIARKVEREHIDSFFINRILENIFENYSLVILDTVSKNVEGVARFNLKRDADILVTSSKSIRTDMSEVISDYSRSTVPLIGVLYNEF